MPVNAGEGRQSLTSKRNETFHNRLMKVPIAKVMLALVLSFAAACGQPRDLKVETLRCEYLVNPLGVDSAQRGPIFPVHSAASASVSRAISAR